MLFFVGHHAFVVSFEGRVGLRFDLREIHSGRLARGHAAVRAGIQLEFVDQVMHGPGIGVAEDDCMPGSRQINKFVMDCPSHLLDRRQSAAVAAARSPATGSRTAGRNGSYRL